MFPKAADPLLVEDLVQQIASSFKRSPGLRAITSSVDALMGPGAQQGVFGRVVIADFDTLEDAMNVLSAESFSDVNSASESLEATHFLFECQEI